MFNNRSLRKMHTDDLLHRIECLEGIARPDRCERAKLAAYYGELRRRGHKTFTVPSMAFPGKARGRLEK